MKRVIQWATGILLLGLAVLPTQAAFNSLFIFGDGLSATADPNAPGDQYFYGQRWSNGRVWVEVLAQRQGLVFDNTKNDSYWDHNSALTLTDVKNLVAPPDVTNDLFVLWVCNADTFDTASALLWNPSYPYVNANILSQSNHLQIITNLYAKGMRTLILPNAVDLSKIPAFDAGTAAPIIQAACVDYDARFSNTISQAKALCPALKIYTPDFFTLLNNVLTNAAGYDLTNALSPKGFSIDAYSDPALPTLILNGPGTNYIFWDPHDPTAEFHEVIADVVQQLISPAQISRLTVLNGSNQLNLANLPIGLNGFVDGSTNLALVNWIALQSFNSTNTTQSIFVSTNGSAQVPSQFSPNDDGPPPPPPGGGSGPNPTVTQQFYRLRFPYAWFWP